MITEIHEKRSYVFLSLNFGNTGDHLWLEMVFTEVIPVINKSNCKKYFEKKRCLVHWLERNHLIEFQFYWVCSSSIKTELWTFWISVVLFWYNQIKLLTIDVNSEWWGKDVLVEFKARVLIFDVICLCILG